MRLLVFGSLNIDHTYHVAHLVRDGETLPSASYQRNIGGKGLNQATALAKAGQHVHFAGKIGNDGLFLREYLASLNVDTSHIQISDIPTGHAIIQVDENAHNSILLYGGANQQITIEQIISVLSHFSSGDYLLMQNEINHGAEIIQLAKRRGIQVILNPSPINSDLLSWPLDQVDWLILNEIEGCSLSGKTAVDAITNALVHRFPDCHIVLTLGSQGSIYAYHDTRIHQDAIKTNAVDTTAAGDTFTGYFIKEVLAGHDIASALHIASHAAAITVSRHGAGESIPFSHEVMTFLQ